MIAFMAAAAFSLSPIRQAPFAHAGGVVRRFVADYGYWSKYQHPAYSAAQVPYARLTHIIHAGIALREAGDGSITVPRGFLEPQLVQRAHAAGVKVMVLVGGSAGLFAEVAESSSARARFAAAMRAFADAHGYDGVDIDWEYPQGARQGSAFALLVACLRRSLPSGRFALSADVAAIPSQVGADYDFADSLTQLDFINDMTYDMAGPWTSSAQINSPILPDPHDPSPDGSVKRSIDLLEGEYGVPAAMIDVGNPFYGYRYTTVDDLYDPCRCTGQASYQLYGTYIKPRIGALGWQREMDWKTGNPYLLYGPGENGFITYDDANSTYARSAYALWVRGVGGIFMWSLDADYDGRSQDLFDAMSAAFERRPLTAAASSR